MTSQRLTTRQVTSYTNDLNEYVRLTTNYQNILPIKKIPEGKFHTYYVEEEIEVPTGSAMGMEAKTVRAARAESTVSITEYAYAFNIPRVEVDMGTQSGVPVMNDSISGALKTMNDTLCHLQINGTFSWDPVSINGMRDGGTTYAGADATAWNVVPGPLETHAATGWGELHDAGFSGPFKWILSSNLAFGLKKKYGAGDPSMETMLGTYDISEVLYLPTGVSTKLTPYPMGYRTADDGIHVMYTNNVQHAYLGEVFAPTVEIDPQLDMETQSYKGHIKWRGTVVVVQAKSIQLTASVDFD